MPRALEQVAHLRNAAMALEHRPASCRTVRAIVVVDGKPRPRKLRAGSGLCLYWGNMSGGRMRISQLRARGAQLQVPTTWFVMPAGTVNGFGPYETVTPREFRQVVRDEGGKYGCTTIHSGSHYGARYYATAGGPVTIPHTIRPGGARVDVTVVPRRREALPSAVRALRRLRCGRHAVDGRPVKCKTPRAVVLADGRPRPAKLTIRRRVDCVVWGNQGRHALMIDSRRCPRCFFHTALEPGSAGVNYFGAAVPRRFPHPIPYTVKPGGHRGTIVLEQD